MAINKFKLISLSHHTAPVEIRETFYFNENECKNLLATLCDYVKTKDLLVLSTCNRTEIYYSSNKDFSREIIKILCLNKGVFRKSSLEKYFQVSNDPDYTIRHLYRVALGLDSQVLADTQIPNQVKRAYSLSADFNMASPALHRLMHSVFHAHKKVETGTSFRDGAASLSYAAVKLAEDLTNHIKGPSALVIGLGETGRDVVRNFEGTSFRKIFITNRTGAKAKKLTAEFSHAENFSVIPVPFNTVYSHIHIADVVICAIHSHKPLITRTKVHGNFPQAKYFIDLSVPRSIDTNIEDLPGAVLYNIDELKAKADATLKKRRKEIPLVEAIIENSIEELKEWAKETEISPTIHKMKAALEEIRRNELKKYLKGLTVHETRRVEEITKNIVQKILKLPVIQLKAACKRGETESLVGVLNDLFDLERVRKNNIEKHPVQEENN